MKRILAALLSATMIFGLAACGGSETESEGTAESTETPTYKIGILTGTVSQGEEEFRAAEKMKEKYGDMIITKTYPDNFMNPMSGSYGSYPNLRKWTVGVNLSF